MLKKLKNVLSVETISAFLFAFTIVAFVLFVTFMVYKSLPKISAEAKPVENKSDNSRMLEVANGQTSYFVPYVILRDTTTGTEYLSFHNGGVVKLENTKEKSQ